jgi:prepilin-type N-terminal cleavage/methylation domain-containing protein
MNSAKPVKTQWTWDEWQAGRLARREFSLRVGQPVCRRTESSSDRRLRAAFDGERAPGLEDVKGDAGFTLREVIAVLALLALLAVAAVPVIQNSIRVSRMSECGKRACDVFRALSAINTDREPLGKAPLPDGRFTNSTDLFRYLIEQEHAPGLAYTSLACSGVPVCQNGNLKPENNMWTVIKEWRDEMEDIVPVLCTRNLDASSFTFNGAGTPLRFDPEWKTPLGARGCVIVRKGGAIFMARDKYVTNRVLFTGGQPADSRPVRYLTPSKEVVAGE